MARPVTVAHRVLTALASVGLLVVVAGCAAGPLSSDQAPVEPSQAATLTPPVGGADGSRTAAPTASPTPILAFPSIDMFVVPMSSLPIQPNGADPSSLGDPRRPPGVQDAEWLDRKAAGLVTLVQGHIGWFDPNSNPMTLNGSPLPQATALDTDWSRWIVEPYGYGVDAKGQTYSDESYWDLCGPGAATVALYYWQQMRGSPDVTGMSGSFVDPYAAEGVNWPSPGPHLPTSGSGKRVGTYWAGTDKANGFEAHGRGFMMYLATVAQPDTWSATGIAAFSEPRSNKPAYPLWGTSRGNMQDGLNWEISGHAPGWANTWYASVVKSDPTLAHDLQTAVTLDVGRDGVPVLVALDTADLPNWQTASGAPHVRHSVAIVGYDNESDPPTYTYLDTCGRMCTRGGTIRTARSTRSRRRRWSPRSPTPWGPASSGSPNSCIWVSRGTFREIHACVKMCGSVNSIAPRSGQ